MASIIGSLPTTVDPSEDWLVDLWAAKLQMSPDGLRQAILAAGPQITKVQRHLNDGFRIAIRDSSGQLRLAARLTTCNGGFGVSVPYHPAKNGWLYKSPYHYGRGEGFVPITEFTHYTVNDRVKLSIHMNGFVQFSAGGGQPIISGFNQELQEAKGLGLKTYDPIIVTSGPLFSVVLYGLQDFNSLGSKQGEVFEPSDFWHHPKFSAPEHTAYNLEFFMFHRSIVGEARIIQGKRLLRKELPFNSQFRFRHELRVIEFAGLDVFLGLILSRFPAFLPEEQPSGYMIAGPGCGGPGEQMYGIGARYPCPHFVSEHNPKCLDASQPTQDTQENTTDLRGSVPTNACSTPRIQGSN